MNSHLLPWLELEFYSHHFVQLPASSLPIIHIQNTAYTSWALLLFLLTESKKSDKKEEISQLHLECNWQICSTMFQWLLPWVTVVVLFLATSGDTSMRKTCRERVSGFPLELRSPRVSLHSLESPLEENRNADPHTNTVSTWWRGQGWRDVSWDSWDGAVPMVTLANLCLSAHTLDYMTQTESDGKVRIHTLQKGSTHEQGDINHTDSGQRIKDPEKEFRQLA